MLKGELQKLHGQYFNNLTYEVNKLRGKLKEARDQLRIDPLNKQLQITEGEAEKEFWRVSYLVELMLM